MFNVVLTDERERYFGHQSALLKSFKDDYLNENGEYVYQRMSNRVTTSYAVGVGASSTPRPRGPERAYVKVSHLKAIRTSTIQNRVVYLKL